MFVKAKPNESIDSLLKRFKRAVNNAGILADLRRHEAHEKPGVRRRKKSEAARKREAKRIAKGLEPPRMKNKHFKFDERGEKVPWKR